MKTLKNKMKNKKGFTLMEMLIVIAIMVVLMAIAIPTFSNQLEGARIATDDANLRSAKSVAMTSAIGQVEKIGEVKMEIGCIYDYEKGEFVAKNTTVKDEWKAKSKKYEGFLRI